MRDALAPLRKQQRCDESLKISKAGFRKGRGSKYLDKITSLFFNYLPCHSEERSKACSFATLKDKL